MTASLPLVSIVMPAYNAERWLDEALQSAIGQTYPSVEIIIVDDGSSDGSLALAQRFEQANPDRVRIIAQENAGACAARNRGLAEARGEFVKFLDADDVLATDIIQKQVESALAFRPEERVVPYASLVACDATLTPRREWRRRPDFFASLFSEDTADRAAALISHNVPTPLPLHRREWLLEIGGFREDLRRGQEYDLHLRLALSGVRFLHVPEVGVYVRQHESETRISNRPRESAASYLAAFRARRAQLAAALGEPLPLAVHAALLGQLWNRARSLLWNEDLDGAHLLAEAARELDPRLRHAPSRAFRLVGQVLGPIRGEQALMLTRRVLRQG